jgi:signal-transduction protein with cAMP-binding, CBS, and nucleotidyltransferase domain
MVNEFKYGTYEPNENIITEGERGLKMYIIVSGQTTVHKDGIGIVGQLGKGKSFGEIALTQGKDLRTATVTAVTKVETLSLQRNDYEFFVRDIQENEKRENFSLLTHCKLFKGWPKAKIEKMSNSCQRKTFEKEDYVFRQVLRSPEWDL